MVLLVFIGMQNVFAETFVPPEMEEDVYGFFEDLETEEVVEWCALLFEFEKRVAESVFDDVGVYICYKGRDEAMMAIDFIIEELVARDYAE
jgi:hypothetical protein